MKQSIFKPGDARTRHKISLVPGDEGQTEGTEESLTSIVQTPEGGGRTSEAGGHPAGKHQHLS